MNISMKACHAELRAGNDSTILIFNDEIGNEISVELTLEQSKELMKALYDWTLVKHSDVRFMLKHADDIIRDFTDVKNYFCN